MEYDNELYEKLHRLQWLLSRQHMQNHADRGPFADPSRGQGRVLAMLKLQPEISTKDLAYLLGIRHQSLNELLNKLEKSGYITRTPSETDRRVMMIRLTEQGKAEPQQQAHFTNVFDCLSAEEQAAFGDYLDRITAALESRLGAGAEDQARASWEAAARDRMGNEMFERLMMRGRSRRDHGRHGFGDFRRGGPEGRGPAPEEIPGAERFAPGYDGPMPQGRDWNPWEDDRDGEPAPPPPPPKDPPEER